MRNPKLVSYETIVKATSGEPEAIDEVLRHYGKRIRLASLENGQVNKDTEDNIKRRLIAALLSLPKKNREIIFLYFFGDYTQQEIGEMYGRCRSTTGYQIRRTLKLLQRKMEVLSHGESESFAL